MNRLMILTAAVLVALAMQSTAHAQSTYPYAQPNYGPYYQPRLSPYLNMLRGGNSASNYYLGVVPEFERRTNERYLQSSVLSLEQRQENPPEATDIFSPLPGTGHVTAFGNFGSYFNQAPRLNLSTQPGAAFGQQQQQRRR